MSDCRILYFTSWRLFVGSWGPWWASFLTPFLHTVSAYRCHGGGLQDGGTHPLLVKPSGGSCGCLHVSLPAVFASLFLVALFFLLPPLSHSHLSSSLLVNMTSFISSQCLQVFTSPPPASSSFHLSIYINDFVFVSLQNAINFPSIHTYPVT